MPSPYDDIIGWDAQQWRREIEERQVHTSIYTDRHGADDPPTPPVVRIDTTEVIPTKFTEVATPTYVEQPFPATVTPCPPAITVQFSGITVECGCSMFSDGSAGSFMITDEGDLNSFVTGLSLGSVISSNCGDCGPEGSRLIWLWAVGETPHVILSYWNEEDDCSGGPTGTDFTQFTGVLMVKVSGTYYLAMFFLQSLVFLGSTTDLSFPIVNSLSCDSGFHDYSGEPWGCMFNGIATPTFDSVGAGGIAIVTIL